MIRTILLAALSTGLLFAAAACEPLVRCSTDLHCPFDRVCDTRQNLCLEKDDPALPDGGGVGGGTGTGTADGGDAGSGSGSDGGGATDAGGSADAGCATNGCSGVTTCCPNGACATVCL